MKHPTFGSQATHPMQPVVLDEVGCPRFKPNAIVRWLVDTKRANLNEIGEDRFSREDMAQFWQLLGYSTSGYGDLHFVPEAVRDEADRLADALLAQKKGATK